MLGKCPLIEIEYKCRKRSLKEQSMAKIFRKKQACIFKSTEKSSIYIKLILKNIVLNETRLVSLIVFRLFHVLKIGKLVRFKSFKEKKLIKNRIIRPQK